MTWLRDVRQMLLALVMSLILWVFVTINTNPTETAPYNDIPLDVRGLSPGLVIVDENGIPRPSQQELAPVSVIVETDRATLEELSPGDLEAFVDLSERGAGAHTVEVNIESTRSGVRFVSVTPSSIPIRLERIITRTVPVTIELQGTLPFGFERDEPTISVDDQPIDEVEVRGPESRIERVVVAANTIAIDQLRASFSSTLPLEALDATGEVVEGVTLSPEQVNVSMDIRSAVGLRRVPILGDVVGSPAPGYIVTSIESDPSLITLVGSSRVLDTIERIETAPVDIGSATGTITRQVPLLLRGLQPQEGEPGMVTVVVRIEPLQQPVQIQVRVPVQVEGAGPGLTVDVSEPVITVELEGSVQAFVQVPFDTLVATVDASGLTEGSYVIRPRLDLPGAIRLANPLPEVTLNLNRVPSPTPAPTTPPPPTTTPVPQPTQEPAPQPQPTQEPAPLSSPTPVPPLPTATVPPEPTTEPTEDATESGGTDEPDAAPTAATTPAEAPDGQPPQEPGENTSSVPTSLPTEETYPGAPQQGGA